MSFVLFLRIHDWCFSAKSRFQSELMIFHYTACPSYSLHVTMPGINGFKLIPWLSWLMFQSTLFAAPLYMQVVSTAL